ncbi:MAG TPA: hypothetical protein VKB95_01710 [Chitinophagaceae bacterium]|nr:hypothetical protein [Chitinophagaceae bacterium]
MKKVLFILGLLFVTSVPLFAQDDTDDDQNGAGEKIRDKMNEFIQKRLDLSSGEAEKFTPIFLRYFKEWRQTLRENRADKLILQQKIIDLRLRYRPQFREIIGERRGNMVYHHQDIFIRELQDIRLRRLQNNPNRPLKRPVNRLF